MPLVDPLAETEGTGPAKLKVVVLTDVGVVEINPELFALNENAFSGSAVAVFSLPLAQ